MADAFPRLTGSPTTGPAVTEHWWQPSVPRWYESAPTNRGGFEKVAIYGFGFFYTHAARQLPNGKWSSKLGKAEDIEHDSPDDVAGGVYGEVVLFMSHLLPTDV